MSGRIIRKYQLGDEEVYGVFCDCSGQMVSPLLGSAEEIARYATENHTSIADVRDSYEEWLSSAKCAETRYSVGQDKLLYAVKAIYKLKNGERVDTEDMHALAHIFDFISAYVAPHQHSYPEIADNLVKMWIDQLDMRDDYPGYEDSDIVDEAEYRVYGSVMSNRHYSQANGDSLAGFQDPPTTKECILVGKYLEGLLLVTQRKIAEMRKQIGSSIMLSFLEMEGSE